MQTQQNNYNGYDLFLDVEDKALRNRNRAVCLYNIFESHSHNGLLSARGTSDMVGYVQAVPKDERAEVVSTLSLMLKNEGNA